jgi:putative chitinase
MIDVATLVRCGIHPTQARLHAPHLANACALFGVTEPREIAGIVAQFGHETQSFTAMEECLYYRDPARAVLLFRTAFDKDRDGVADPQEIAEAMRYMKNSEMMANRAYANRSGNGPESSGDGWKYRGRGYTHLTFLDNYRIAAAMPGAADYVRYPDLVAQPEHAALTGFNYWKKNRVGEALLASNIDAATRIINPGMAGKQDRRDRFAVACEVFGV